MRHSMMTRLRDRGGAALPVALFGLVAVSLLVTTALLTSNTEFAISAAHRGAAASLYNSDAALEQFVANRFAAGGTEWMEPGTGQVTGPDNRVYDVRVSRMSQRITPTPRTQPRALAEEVFSLVVSPRNDRGRAVGAFLRVRRATDRLRTNINAGATSGGNVQVSGNATISDGRSGVNYCNTEDNQSDYSVQVTAGSRVTVGNNATGNMEGPTNVTTYTKERLAEMVLGPGMTLDRLASYAEFKFGPVFDQPAFGNTRPNATRTGTEAKYNWGCPQVLMTDFTCPPGSADKDVVVAIDANGGDITINGDYGQGMLIVLNGSLRIQGNFVFKGIILVERDMRVLGGQGGQESKIEGSIIAFGESSTVEDNFSGTATVKYNFCAIQDAENALNNKSALRGPQERTGGTHAWYELIR